MEKERLRQQHLQPSPVSQQGQEPPASPRQNQEPPASPQQKPPASPHLEQHTASPPPQEEATQMPEQNTREDLEPENGSVFCSAENEQTEADQATAADAQGKSLSLSMEITLRSLWKSLFHISVCVTFITAFD